MKGFFYDIGHNVLSSFKGKNIYLHVLAATLTALIVFSGFDWAYFTAINGSDIGPFLWPAIALGGLLPIVIPFTLLILGQLRKNRNMTNTAYALAQAALLGLVISSFYKAFTGRIPPHFHGETLLVDMSHGFQFGFMRGGIFWGWPSSHTTVAFATMVTLFVLYPKNTYLRILALCYAFYVGFGVSVGIHWFSEFVAGALVGTAIGMTVGTSFFKRLRTSAKKE